MGAHVPPLGDSVLGVVLVHNAVRANDQWALPSIRAYCAHAKLWKAAQVTDLGDDAGSAALAEVEDHAESVALPPDVSQR